MEEMTLTEAQRAVPLARYTEALQARVDALQQRTEIPPLTGHLAGRRFPSIIPLLYEIQNPVTARRNAASPGHEASAPLTTPGQFILPRNYPRGVLIGADGPWFWESSNVFGYLSLTYNANPAHAAAVTLQASVGDIFDAVLDGNGGAAAMHHFFRRVPFVNFVAQTQDDMANISAGLELFDAGKGARLHDGSRLPLELFSGQHHENRANAVRQRFEPGTTIEPRLYVDEVRMGTLLDTAAAFTGADARAYVQIVLSGEKALEESP